MTLVLAWRSAEMLTVCADTLIENGASTITNVGQKIFQVPVDVTPMGAEEHSFAKLPVGFAFAGNTLMAQSCCAIASTCLASLSVRSEEDEISPRAIARFFSRSAEHVCQERRFLRPNDNHRFQAIVFGWDQVERNPFVYNVAVDEVDSQLVASCEYSEVPIGGLAYFGSGAQFIRSELERLEAEAQPRLIEPHELMEAAIRAADLRSVGGSFQFATATETGVRLRPHARIESSGMAEFSVLGCDIWKLADPNGPIPIAGAVALPVRPD